MDFINGFHGNNEFEKNMKNLIRKKEIKKRVK